MAVLRRDCDLANWLLFLLHTVGQANSDKCVFGKQVGFLHHLNPQRGQCLYAHPHLCPPLQRSPQIHTFWMSLAWFMTVLGVQYSKLHGYKGI